MWRVAFGGLRFIFFGRCLALQLPPPAKRRDGGGVAAAAAGSSARCPAAGVKLRSSACRQAPGAVATKSVQSGTYPHNA